MSQGPKCILSTGCGSEQAGSSSVGLNLPFCWLVVAHIFNASTLEAEASGSEFKANLVYRVRFKTAKAT